MSASARVTANYDARDGTHYYYAYLIDSGALVGDEVSDPYSTVADARQDERDVVARHPLARLARVTIDGTYEFVPTNFQRALTAFVDAAAAFSEVWGIAQSAELRGTAEQRDVDAATAAYLRYLPSFDEFVADLLNMRATVDEREEVTT